MKIICGPYYSEVSGAFARSSVSIDRVRRWADKVKIEFFDLNSEFHYVIFTFSEEGWLALSLADPYLYELVKCYKYD